MSGGFRAEAAARLTEKAESKLASEADVTAICEYIKERAALGKYDAVISVINLGQVLALESLGYDIEWNGEGSFCTVSWEPFSYG